MYKDYLRRCEDGNLEIGEPYLFRGERHLFSESPLEDKWILNFPTKKHWRSRSRLVDIQKGLDHIYNNYREWGIESLAVPALGCGEGHLKWREVGPVLYQGLVELSIPVELYAPVGTPDEELQGWLVTGI